MWSQNTSMDLGAATQQSDVSMEDLRYYNNIGAQLNTLAQSGPAQTMPGSESIVTAMNRNIASLPPVISVAEPEPVHRTRSRAKATTPPPPKEVKEVKEVKETRAQKAAKTKAEKAAKAANERAAAEAERVRLAVKFEKILTSGTFVDDEAREAYLLSVFDGEMPDELVGLTEYDLIAAATEMIVSRIMDGTIEESAISDMTGGANNNTNYRNRRPPAINTRNRNNARQNVNFNSPTTPNRRTRRNMGNVRANRSAVLRRRRSRSTSRNRIHQPDFSVEERVLPSGATDAITWELIKDGDEMVDIKMTDTYNSELQEPLYYTYDTYIGLHGKHPQSRRPIAATARFYTARIPPENVNSSYGSNNTQPTRRYSNINVNGGSKRTRKNRKHK